MVKKQLEKKIQRILKASKNGLDQIEIAQKINVNPFIVDKVLNEFIKKGFVEVIK
jgi:Mn-dependent DtxR family transcriptional regulator